MVEVRNALFENDYVVVEYLTNGITISTRVYNTDGMTPQEIAEAGYGELKPHIDIECNRLNIVPDHTLPTVEDDIVSIEILGLADVSFREELPPMELPLRCVGHTKYGKTVDLVEQTVFTSTSGILDGRILTINPTETEKITVSAKCNEFVTERSFNVLYTSLADIEAQRLADEAMKADELRRQQEEASKVLPPTQEERIAALEAALAALMGV